MVQEWHWYTPLRDGTFWYDAFNLGPEAQDLAVGIAETVGQAAGAIVKPTSDAVAAPLRPLAWIAVALVAGAVVFRKEIKGFIK